MYFQPQVSKYIVLACSAALHGTTQKSVQVMYSTRRKSQHKPMFRQTNDITSITCTTTVCHCTHLARTLSQLTRVCNTNLRLGCSGAGHRTWHPQTSPLPLWQEVQRCRQEVTTRGSCKVAHVVIKKLLHEQKSCQTAIHCSSAATKGLSQHAKPTAEPQHGATVSLFLSFFSPLCFIPVSQHCRWATELPIRCHQWEKHCTCVC